MKLLLNLSTLGPRPTGLGVYATRCAVAASKALQCGVVGTASPSASAPLVTQSPADVALGGGRFAAARRWAWARRVSPGQAFLVYSPTHHGLPRAASDGHGQILTVHDLIALRYPKQHPLQALYFRTVLRRQLSQCRAVFTVSQTSRTDLHEHFGLPLDRIHVVPNGVDTTVFTPAPAGAAREPFLLMVGAAYRHKNVQEVLTMSGLWRHRYSLKIASCRGGYRQQLQRQVAELQLGDRVEFLDYVSQPQLVELYRRCSALLYPSLWEGFGIPPLEAMACGAPVIASDIPVHREVLGSHAQLVRLGDESAWGAAFDTLSTAAPAPAGHMDQQRETSPIRRFSWDGSAGALIRSLCEVEPRLELCADREP